MSYRIEAVQSSRSPGFEEAYRALFSEFAGRGELERREVITNWLDQRGPADAAPDGIQRVYHLLVGRDETGALAGVRDCHVLLEAEARIVVVYLAHVLVLPPHRRTGLAATFRRAPIELARRALGDGDREGFDLLLAAEMEPADAEDTASLVRLAAYAKDGFAAIAPQALPYFQPDFGDLGPNPSLPDARPLPLLAVVRNVGREGTPAISKTLARAFVRHLYAVFATHVDPRQLQALKQHTLGVLDAYPGHEVPLLPLPCSTEDHAAISKLTRSSMYSTLPGRFARRSS